MRLNQLQFLGDGRLPADLSEALVFDSKNLEKLQERIKELKQEKEAEKKLFKWVELFLFGFLHYLSKHYQQQQQQN